MDLSQLLPYATPKQAEKIKAVIKHGSHSKAAKAVGCIKSGITRAIKQVRIKAAKRDISAHNENGIVPEGFAINGTSILYGPEGEKKIGWVKTDAEKEAQGALLREFADSLCEQVAGKCQLNTKLPKNSNKDLLTIYPQPEPHYGLFSWGKETGEDYDCTIASNLLLDCMQQLTNSAPSSYYGMVSSVGDWFHMDNTDNRTAKAGNQLDVDTRHPRVVKLGVAVFVQMVDLALLKHHIVHIKGVGGNHDPLTNYLLAMVLNAFYRDNDRVIVDLEPGPFKYHRFGKNLVGINHGDMAKADQLPLIMLADRPQDCGETEHRLWLTGHIHHLTRKEFTGGIVVESIRSIAAKDSWHNASGYRSGRDAKAIVLHKDKGEIQRITVAI